MTGLTRVRHGLPAAVGARGATRRRDPLLARIAFWLLLLLAAGTVIIPMVARQDPLAIGDVLANRLLPPFSTDAQGHFHLLGTDRFGRDLFVRMMLAGRLSLAIGVAGSLLAAAGLT
jgi:peptide/nickel transport system permease protein